MPPPRDSLLSLCRFFLAALAPPVALLPKVFFAFFAHRHDRSLDERVSSRAASRRARGALGGSAHRSRAGAPPATCQPPLARFLPGSNRGLCESLAERRRCFG